MLKRTVVVKSAWGDIVKLREGGYLVEFKRQDGSYADDSVKTSNFARARAELGFYANTITESILPPRSGAKRRLHRTEATHP